MHHVCSVPHEARSVVDTQHMGDATGALIRLTLP
jgi:hypothetical protein